VSSFFATPHPWTLKGSFAAGFLFAFDFLTTFELLLDEVFLIVRTPPVFDGESLSFLATADPWTVEGSFAVGLFLAFDFLAAFVLSLD
jgi:hypothetical protein